jgi:hypothetical protein
MPMSDPIHYLVHNYLLANAMAACDLLDLRVEFQGVVQLEPWEVVRVHLALTWLDKADPNDSARALLQMYGKLDEPAPPAGKEG